MVTLSDALALAFKSIKIANTDGRWNEALAWSQHVDWTVKTWKDWRPFITLDASTTFSAHEVKLERNFLSFKNTPFSWAEIVVHELRHTLQYKGQNDLAFYAKYAVNPAFRAAMECEAEVEQLRYLIRAHRISPQSLQAYLIDKVTHTLKDHFLSDKYYQLFWNALNQTANQEFAK